MKIMLIMLAIAITTTGCKKDEGPTIFKGKVVFADDSSAYTEGKLLISMHQNVLSSTTIDSKEITLDDVGGFETSFEYNERADYFRLIILKTTGNIEAINQDRGLDCSTNDCDNFKPGFAYTELVIKVPR